MIVSTGVDPIQLTEYSVVFSVVVLPLTYFPVLLVARDRDLHGRARERAVASFFGWLYMGVILVVARRRDPAADRDQRRWRLMATRERDRPRLPAARPRPRRLRGPPLRQGRRPRVRRRPGRAHLRRGPAQRPRGAAGAFLRRLRRPPGVSSAAASPRAARAGRGLRRHGDAARRPRKSWASARATAGSPRCSRAGRSG